MLALAPFALVPSRRLAPEAEPPTESSGAPCGAQLVLDVSLPHTGTKSFSEMLAGLGFATHHNMADAFTREQFTRLHASEFAPSAGGRSRFDLLANHTRSAPSAFGGHPMPAIACELASMHRRRENTIFVHRQRPRDEWAESFSAMLCASTASQVCPAAAEAQAATTNAWDLHVWAYGPMFLDFCRQRRTLCAEAPPYAKSPKWTAMTAQIRAYHDAHTARMACLPAERTLSFRLDDFDRADVAGNLTSALGCLAPIPSEWLDVRATDEPAEERQPVADIGQVGEDADFSPVPSGRLEPSRPEVGPAGGEQVRG